MSSVSGNLPTTEDPRLRTSPAAMNTVIQEVDVQQRIAMHYHTLAIEFYKQGMDNMILELARTLFLNGL